MTHETLCLRPFRRADAEVIAAWPQTEEGFIKWSAGILGSYPITAGRMLEATAARDDSDRYFPFVLTEGGRVTGFLIMRHPTEDRSVLRFGFVIVDPAMKGRGYGKKMLRLGVRFAFEVYGAQKVTLGVFDNNPPAYHCYRSVGFTETGETESYQLNGQTWNCIEMALVRP